MEVDTAHVTWLAVGYWTWVGLLEACLLHCATLVFRFYTLVQEMQLRWSFVHHASTLWLVRHLVGTVCFIFCTVRTQMLCQHFRRRHRQRLYRQVHHRSLHHVFESRATHLTKTNFLYKSFSFYEAEKRKGRGEEGCRPMSKARTPEVN